MLIRAGIFLTAGIICLVFKKQLNNWKNNIFQSLKWKKWVRDETKDYRYLGIVFIGIAIILFIISFI